MKPRLLALLLSIILGVSAAHAQQNPLSDFFHGLGGIFKGTPETQPADQTTPRQSKDLTAESQRLLARLGFDPGSADGIDGPKTRRAIEAFQREQGLTADGQVSDELITRLRMAAAVTTPVAPQSPPPMILTIDGLAPGVYDPTGFVSQTPGRIDSYLMPRIKKSWGEFWNLEEWKNLHYVIWGGDATSTALAVESAKVDIQQLMHAKAPVQSLVIVTHSWGSVIAYRAIIDLYEQGILKPGDVDTFISTGSPLNAQGTVWRKLARGFFQWSGPAPVANAVREWRNYYIESADKKSGPIPGTYANLTNISLPYTGARGKSAHKAYHADPLLLRQIGRDLLNTLRKPEPLVPPTETVQQPTTPSTTTTYMTAEAGTGESWIGIRVTDPRCGPPEVTEVVPGSPVDKAGVRPGDVILEFIASQWPNNHGFFGSSLGCGLPGQEATRLFNAVQDTPAGQSATLTIRRDKKRLTLTLIVGTRPAMPTPGGSVPAQTEAIHPSQSSDVSSLASNQMGTIVLKMIGAGRRFPRVEECVIRFEVTNNTKNKFKDLTIGNLAAIDRDGDVLWKSSSGMRHYGLFLPGESKTVDLVMGYMSCDPVAVLAFFKKKRQVGYKKYEEEYIVGCTTTRGRFQGLKCGRLTLDPSTKEQTLIANVEYAHQQ